jgi:serine/threonine-protein kinase
MSMRLGSNFGSYRLDSLLGSGGMGVVYLATDLRLGRRVALKVIAPELAAQPSFRSRFVREAQLAASLEHPSIVTIHEVGEVNGELYLTMRFVPGRNLASILRLEAPLDPERTVWLLGQVASALDYAHANGLVHRDVSPRNILVEPSTEGHERASLVDFGLSREVGDGETVTRPGQIVGSVDTIAPEQIEGGRIDGRADQYALACAMFLCLTGRPPFVGDLDAVVLYGHVHTPPPMVRGLQPSLPAHLDGVLARGLAKRPGDRFASCSDLVGAARSALGGSSRPLSASVPAQARADASSRSARAASPMDAQSASAPAASGSGSRRRVVLVGATGLVALAGLGAVGYSLLSQGGPAPSPDADASTPLVGPIADGLIVFVSDADGQGDLYSVRPDGSDLRQLTSGPNDDRDPALSPDGNNILFSSDIDGTRDLYLLPRGASTPRQVTFSTDPDEHPSWAPDGRGFIFVRVTPGNDGDLRTRGNAFAPAADERSVPLTAGGSDDRDPAWSGSNAIAMSRARNGPAHIFRRQPGPETPWEMLTRGAETDTDPAWSPIETRLAFVRRYVAGGSDLFTMDNFGANLVSLTTGPEDDADPAWDPSGEFVVFARRTGERSKLVVIEVASKRTTAIAIDLASVSAPVWGEDPARDVPASARPSPTL